MNFRQHMERKIYSMCWKINWNEIDRVQEPEKSRMNLRAKNTSLMVTFLNFDLRNSCIEMIVLFVLDIIQYSWRSNNYTYWIF